MPGTNASAMNEWGPSGDRLVDGLAIRLTLGMFPLGCDSRIEMTHIRYRTRTLRGPLNLMILRLDVSPAQCAAGSLCEF